MDQLMQIINPPAVVRSVDEAAMSEEQLIAAAKSCVGSESGAKWLIGRLAHEWTVAYAKGRTDADFAEMIGGLQTFQVTQRRLVYAAFGDVSTSRLNLSWTHYREAAGWDDAEEWLAEADENEWSVARMIQERKEAYAPVDDSYFDDEPANDPKPVEPVEPVEPAKPKDKKDRAATSKTKTVEADDEDEDPATETVEPTSTLPAPPSSAHSAPATIAPDDEMDPEEGDSDTELCRKACNRLIKHVIPRIGENGLIIDRYMRANHIGSIDTQRLNDLQAEIFKVFDQARRRLAQ